MKRIEILVFCLAVLAASPASANITVNGTVRYWNGDQENADGTTGGYVPAKYLQIQVENDQKLVGDIDTYTDADGKYEVTFKQKAYRPDFKSLKINIEVRARVLLDAFKKKWAVDVENTVSAYKGAVRLYPYNGQTRAVKVNDGNTVTINVYVHGPDKTFDEGVMNGRYALPIASWDYDDNGRRTVAAIFLCQVCLDEYRFLRDKAANQEELARGTSIFYPEDKAAYRDTQSPVGIPKICQGKGWIDMCSRKLFDEKKTKDERWYQWRDLRCTTLHEFSHKLMHDVYWTLPKTHPWMSSEHNSRSCSSGEMGWREGWAQFLPAAVLKIPTMTGQPVSAAKRLNGKNLEHVWYPVPAGMADPPCDDVPGDLGWRDGIKGRRDWNEIEVAAVLWDVYDSPSWEYMPKAEQDKKPAGWPGELEWYERLHDPDLERIWKMVKKQPEALNDEDEMKINRDSFWTFWLKEYGDDKELVHGLKAILHNRSIRHTLRPENKPEILGVRPLGNVSGTSFVLVTVKESDKEDRLYLFYNIAYGLGGKLTTKMHSTDQPLKGTWSDDVLKAFVVLPPQDKWDRLVLMVHDNMEVDFIDPQDPTWKPAGGGAGNWPLQLIAAGGSRATAWRTDGTVWTWGSGKPRGNLNADTRGAKSHAEWRLVQRTPIQTVGLDGVTFVAVGGQHSVAVRIDGTVWTWGNNYAGALGIGDDKSVIRTRKTTTLNQVAGLAGVAIVAAGGSSNLALRRNGELWAWGSNAHGCLGDGTTENRRSPVRIRGLAGVNAIAMGINLALAIDSAGSVWAWGQNDSGQVGDGTTKDRHTPVRVRGVGRKDRKAVAVAVRGSQYPIALCEDGTVWEWGVRRRLDNWRRRQVITTPQRVSGLANIVAIAADSGHLLALDRDGTVWAWGNNHGGQLGDGTTTDRWRVAKVADLTDVIAIAAGSSQSFAVRSDGTVWAWGSRTSHALGDGAFQNRTKPVQVQTFRRIAEKSQRETEDAFVLEPFRLFTR